VVGHTTTVKNGKVRRKPLPPLLADAIDAMLAARGHPTGGPLFLTRSGIPIYELYVYRLARRAGLPAGSLRTRCGTPPSPSFSTSATAICAAPRTSPTTSPRSRIGAGSDGRGSPRQRLYCRAS
jgi:hypothetical protein